MGYTINYGNKRLSGFYPNDLPVGKNGQFSPRTIFSFRNRDYLLFDSEADANRYMSFIRGEIMNPDNKIRYESAVPGSTVQLLALAGRLKPVINN